MIFFVPGNGEQRGLVAHQDLFRLARLVEGQPGVGQCFIRVVSQGSDVHQACTAGHGDGLACQFHVVFTDLLDHPSACLGSDPVLLPPDQQCKAMITEA